MAATRAARTASPARGVELAAGLAAVVALLAAGAGILHLLAAREHLEHPLIAAFFVNLAVAQFAWAGVLVRDRSRAVLLAGIVGNLAVVAIWMLSRTTGIPLFEATSEVEPIGMADAAATLFEITAAAGAGLLLVLPAEALRALLSPARAQRLVASTGAIALLLTIPGFVTEGHHHEHEHGDTDVLAAAHTHTEGELAGVDHALDDHTHVPGSSLVPGAEQTVPHDHSHLTPIGEAAPAGVVDHNAPGHIHDPSHHHADVSGTPSGGDASAAPHNHAHAAPSSSSSQQTMTPPPMPRPRGKVAEMLYGPFYLPSVDTGGQAHMNRILPAIAPPCTRCMVTAMYPDLVYVDGTSANMDTGPMLHHTVIFDPSEPDPTCGRNGVGFMGHRLFASGNERTGMIMPEGYALPIGSPWWVGIFELMNHSLKSQVVFFKLTVRYLPMDDASVKPVTPIWLDVDNCADSEFAVPKGESVTTWKWKSNITGRIVAAGGHVHDGGISITMSNATRHERMCTSYAGYGTKPEYMGAVESMSICPHDRIGVVRAGETLQLDTYYNELRPTSGVMGIMMAFVYETNDLAGGSAPPAYYTAEPSHDAPPPPSHAGHSH
jgi:hypothetical protein